MADEPVPVPLLDLRRSNLSIKPGLAAAFWRVIDSGQFILGPEVEAFEAKIAKLSDAGHGIGVSSGTDALLLSLMALGIGPGDEVICPTYTFFATAGTVSRCGATPVFVDVCPGCFNMDPEGVQTAITERTRAIMPVHLFGQSAELSPILRIAEAHGLRVIEDAAQALGVLYNNKPVGGFGDVGCFSFFPSKNLGGYGDGGMCVTRDDVLAEKLRVLRVHGGKPKYMHHMIGGNFRLDSLQAALLSVRLQHLSRYAQGRRDHAAQYDQLFSQAGAQRGTCTCTNAAASQPDKEAKFLLPATPQAHHIYNQYVIRVRRRRRDQVKQALQKARIGCEIYYPIPMHLQPCFKHLKYKRGALPNAEAAAEESLALPIYPELMPHEIDRVASVVVQAVNAPW